MFDKIKKIILIILIALIASCSSGRNTFSESQWKKRVEKTDAKLLAAPNHEEGRYFNPWMRMPEGRFSAFLKWRFSCAGEYTDEEKSFMPEFIPNAVQRIRETGKSDFILWIGHHTFLLRVDGKYWLTDPIFSKRALLPARHIPPALKAEELAEISDRFHVIITHNHYDHLDTASLEAIPEDSVFYVPMGLKELIRGLKKKHVHEMNWNHELQVDGKTRLICLPAQHWSRRITQSVNQTLWASFLLIAPGLKIYFGGDSGYFKGYREFGKKYPGIDYALLPTTAYHPRWFMHYAHMNIEEALRAFKELGAAYFIPTQWGTFKLGDNPPGHPGLELKRAIKKNNLDREKFYIMDIGEIVLLKKRAG